MAIYITRIEIHNLPDTKREREALYEKLHKHMEAANFEKTITRHGKTYKMPPAMYVYRKTDVTTAAQVDTKAADASRNLTTSRSTFTIKADSMNEIDFFNLEEE